jgi:hypothetical protein
VCSQNQAPAAFTPGKDPVPIVQEAGWAPEPIWIGAENLAPPGFDPRTFQPVASRYTDYAIPAPTHKIEIIINKTAQYQLHKGHFSWPEPRNCEHDTLLRGIFADTVLYGEQKASIFTVPFACDN